MSTVADQVRGKTEQRVTALIECLRQANGPLTYEDLTAKTGAGYDTCLYVLATLVEVGMATKDEVADGPGRPRVRFFWSGSARGVGPR